METFTRVLFGSKSSRPKSTKADASHAAHEKDSPEDSTQHDNIFEPTSMEELSAILNSKTDSDLIVIDFFANWCRPCKKITPCFKDLARDHPHVVFVKVNADLMEDALIAMSVEAMPTFVAMKGKVEFERVVGADKAALTSLVTRLVQ